MYNQTKCMTDCIVAELRKLRSDRPDTFLHILKPSKEEKEVKSHTWSFVFVIALTIPNTEAT